MFVNIEESRGYLTGFHSIEIFRFTTSIIVIAATIISIPLSAAELARSVRKFYSQAEGWVFES